MYINLESDPEFFLITSYFSLFLTLSMYKNVVPCEILTSSIDLS